MSTPSHTPTATELPANLDIGAWLQRLGLSQYTEAFAAQGITAAVLPNLTDEDLEQCGVELLGHRRLILQDVRRMLGSPTPTPQPAVAIPRPNSPSMAAAAAAKPAAAAPRPLPKPSSVAATPRAVQASPAVSVAAVPPPSSASRVAAQPSAISASAGVMQPTVSVAAPAAAVAAAPAKKKFGGKFWAKIAASKFLVVSIAVHFLFGAGATVFVVQQIVAKRKMSFAGGPPNSNPQRRAIEHKVSMAKKKKTMSAPAQAKRITTAGLSRVALPDMPTMPTATDVMPGQMAGMGGTGTGLGLPGGGAGGMSGGGGGMGINFFGLRATVKSIVMVLDISGSMVMGRKNPQTYEELEKEVSKVIRGLDPTAKFGLVAFAKEADPYKVDLAPATPDEKQKAINWFKNMNPSDALKRPRDPGKPFVDYKNGRHQGTNAEEGLDRAFKMKPDTIFFVSDGDPTGASPSAILKMVEDEQKKLSKPATIHAISYMADGGQQFMKDLAERNKGTYRSIEPDKKK